jgi:hypothetical protein
VKISSGKYLARFLLPAIYLAMMIISRQISHLNAISNWTFYGFLSEFFLNSEFRLFL